MKRRYVVTVALKGPVRKNLHRLLAWLEDALENWKNDKEKPMRGVDWYIGD